ncbi:hypothetical protein K7X08_019979 [Anisodus acutangulus]|uniref:Pyrroline-5-carboxylate reductase n=1 Tax=Anisodus acutangulus TaxID=402998 RepID=A0A9Q1MVZ5_9SOLA|nr:hypothetical protein K7X08_019979 [Anisodus acutangulus]
MTSIRLRLTRFFATSKFTYAGWGDLLAVEKRNYHLIQESHDFPQQNMLEINSQLKELVKKGELENARQLFDKMTQRDEVSWTNMISGYVNASSPLQALSLFLEMRRDPSIRMDPFALSLAVKACGLSMNLRCGELLHGYSIKTDFVCSVFVGSSLVDMYMKAGNVLEGCRVFDEMPLRNVVSWTAVITGLVRAGYNEEGLVYFSEMWRDGVECDSYAYAIVLKACADIGCLNYGREMHTRIVKKGLDMSSYVANSLATMYNKCGKLNYGMCLFARMRLQDVVSWTTVITTYVQIGQDQYAIQAFLRMKESSVSPNEYTFAAVVAACANLSRLDWGVQLHANVLCVAADVSNNLMFLSRLPSSSRVACVLALVELEGCDKGKVLWNAVQMGGMKAFPNGECLSDSKVGFIGAGKMAESIAKGVVKSRILPASRIRTAHTGSARPTAFESIGVKIFDTNNQVVEDSDVIIFSVKPQVGMSQLRPFLSEKQLLASVAAGVKLKDLQEWAGQGRFIRVMPNTPSAVGEAATVFTLGEKATTEDGELISQLFGAIGKVWKADEKLFDAVTGLSGSGPAYVFLAIEALADGGVAAGLPRELAVGLASQTVLGAASMVTGMAKHLGQLKGDVASPGGTIIAGIHQLEKSGFRGILMNAVVAAAKRSRELSQN